MNTLDQEERKILEAFESGNVKCSKDTMDILETTSRIRGSYVHEGCLDQYSARPKDLRGLQRKALAEGIPYQALIANILYKYVEGRLHETVAKKTLNN